MSRQTGLFPIARVRARYGNVSDMWVNRRVSETRAALATRGATDLSPDDDSLFPLPVYIGKRRFWAVDRLDRWDRALPLRDGRRALGGERE
jgi:hypothetical protein